MQKELKDNLRIESQASWEKFCNDISLETNHTESWRKIKNFVKPKGQRIIPALQLDAKTAKTIKPFFPLGGIFRAERHFLLFKDQLAESGRQKTKENIIPRGKSPSGNDPNADKVPNLSKETSAFRVTTLIKTTSMRSTSLLRIIMNIFILLKTPMITDRTWMMITTLWPILTLILSLG